MTKIHKKYIKIQEKWQSKVLDQRSKITKLDQHY